MAALGGDFPTDVIIWTVFFVVYQQVENNVIQPQIFRRTVSLHPLVVIVAMLTGATLLGVVGALLAIPIAGAIQIVIKDWWRIRKGEGGTALGPTPWSPCLTRPRRRPRALHAASADAPHGACHRSPLLTFAHRSGGDIEGVAAQR